ncbi:MAG: hypothetical protein A3I26_00950 [Candidatus Yanofskybacteria bacterium RIFCSPLOWO2_02_FULL_43_10]|uniref:Ada DNA repair metal-binding domain-containing protein n=1 Tax=Candidatus Yanofskybacteria bacterium RIFCSPLOWO2_12_FULL_43_11b TaxID=1802710 RepID=A0A1F8H8P2_9BACT|nr:MAG: hypothetical protein A2742_01265 [Candidatus Yanofskybacteria bacterium RIFCSPHIGHO2_01_FULL_43_32]OGN11968.1 MAG: hypothetical protein A3C69_02800 [Candidatus Yanofskybacteria bacterium RIFCSPHIGHO2_02_FULL_43_12]OGN17286.1 MAG: hypothetical protein A3E34_00715 [Candidatus Yanofskybacteria bacterium RIFCSPHIGHO2_12_FULL_43_11]OGN24753.1 MAG: hypothetical protein A2923_02955 [Candidatus Yanofskybacteria bacterium RIFCSPLOWO2_01_FULL_43_46]OGN30610.1 MAG: hypothetical protein A3I26_00950
MNSILAKIIQAVKNHYKDIFLCFCIILIAIIGFNIGRINALNKTPAKTTEKADVYQATTGTPVPNSSKQTPAKPQDLRVVASKASSTKKYHFTWCPGAKQIKEVNKLWFANESLAQKTGYTLAGNCN